MRIASAAIALGFAFALAAIAFACCTLPTTTTDPNSLASAIYSSDAVRAVMDALDELSVRLHRGLGKLSRHMKPASESESSQTASSQAAWTGRLPPLSADLLAQINECRHGALYTTPECMARCVAWSNATLRNPKQEHAMYALAEGRVSCHACPGYMARSNTLFDAVVEANKRLQRVSDAEFVADSESESVSHSELDSGKSAAAKHRPRRPLWGRLLDAGTGTDSLNWALSLAPSRIQEETALDPASITAVTASVDMYRTTLRALQTYQARQDANPRWKQDETVHLVRGAWLNPSLLAKPTSQAWDAQAVWVQSLTSNCEEEEDSDKTAAYEKFDTILADYLIGAVDGFTPFHQHTVLSRLARHMVHGSRMFVLGMEPYPDSASTPGGELVLKVAALRDACILLAGQRPYREYPIEWIQDHLRLANLTIRESITFPVVYGARKLISQLEVCEYKLQLMTELGEQTIREALQERVDALKVAVENDPEIAAGLCFGADYVVVASCDGPSCGY
ncbi:hypothetical protein CAOG_06053 [Capsaspora owczarzaki ATCC 30864]|uniref:Uncharacterized protein n=1 Tax=Capsaspora owczarzaki (strain ATCC 30864) TaxID=595528 RepID=A0A0D2WTA9_CAPO3|nr:hypothetical protein CAOG_06053 [Capsaspora owczarzaki ATCC 30864]KJE95620.1 hypothetical protein CAOG_006053 [Capsaspora owczarzaki ATCC 30864]|eukprot:XP_004345643.2 hypothetical protein CAOG_06053 [Capsaspora owczarzaki ATCC 30864]